MSGPRLLGGLALALSLAAPSSVRPEVLLTENAALERAFPGTTTRRRTVYLTPDQVEAVQRKARSRLPSAMVTVYEARSGDLASVSAEVLVLPCRIRVISLC